MTQILGGRWDNFLRNLFNVKALPIAPSLSPEVQPTLSVEREQAPELEFVRGFQRWAVSGFTAALAANFSQLTIQNNTADYILIVDGWRARDSAGIGTIDIGFDATPAGAVAETGRTFTDGREVLRDVTRRPVATMVGSQNVGSGLTQGFVTYVVGASYDIAVQDMPWVIGPLQRLIFQTSIVNRNLDVCAWGRSRPIEPTED